MRLPFRLSLVVLIWLLSFWLGLVREFFRLETWVFSLLISIVLTVLLFSAQQQYHIKQIKTMSATKNPNPADSPLTISSVNTPPYRACKLKKTPIKKPSWSWSYGSWIYNYLCNQCISPLTLWVRIPLMARCTRYNVMWDWR